jgi:AcrR family transcriptional regulator
MQLTYRPVNLSIARMAEPDMPFRSDAADTLKAAALKLFAERGIDGVTVRQIAEAAGQKNHAAVGYHFGSKEELVRELIVDGARLIDDQRNAWLDAAEAQGGPHSVLETVEGLLRTSLNPHPPEGGEAYNRFVVMLGLTHRKLFMSALEDRWNRGYLRALDHIRRLHPDLPASLMNQRLMFMGAALGGILASRERELADQSRPHPMWSSDSILHEIARSLAAMISPPD